MRELSLKPLPLFESRVAEISLIFEPSDDPPSVFRQSSAHAAHASTHPAKAWTRLLDAIR
jgi:hypothetical protein